MQMNKSNINDQQVFCSCSDECRHKDCSKNVSVKADDHHGNAYEIPLTKINLRVDECDDHAHFGMTA